MSKRILIVDDAAMMRAVLLETLISLDIDVVGQARDGAEAVQMVEDLAPDIVLLDMEMPVMPGLDALKSIKIIRPETVVIMLTAAYSQEAILGCIIAGAADFINKQSFEDIAERLVPFLE